MQDQMYWATVPGCKQPWPVQLLRRDGDRALVFVHSDDAEFWVETTKMRNFNTDVKIRDQNIDFFKTRKLYDTERAFVADYNWASQVLKGLIRAKYVHDSDNPDLHDSDNPDVHDNESSIGEYSDAQSQYMPGSDDGDESSSSVGEDIILGESSQSVGDSDDDVSQGMEVDKQNNEGCDEEMEIIEDEIVRESQDSSIYIKRLLKSTTTKTGRAKKSSRVYNTKHVCPFCRKLVANFAQHVQGKLHQSEKEIQDLKGISGKEKGRRLSLMRNKADHRHNMNVKSIKKGEILLARREEINNFTLANYGPCPHCFLWLRLSVIARHQSTCPGVVGQEVEKSSKGAITIQSKILSDAITSEASNGLKKEVFPIMKRDEIGRVAQGDKLIVSLGNQWLLRNIGNKLMRKYYVSAVMRLISRLLIAVRVITGQTKSMEEYIHPRYFTHLAAAALKVAKADSDDEEEMKAPSNAIKISFDLKRLANIKLANGIKEEDKEMRRNAKDFLFLMNSEWTTKLARVVLQERKYNAKKPLPLPEDIEKLATFIKSKSIQFDLSIKTPAHFREVAMVSLAGLIGFNRRRPGETQAITMTEYANRTTGLNEMDQAMAGQLTSFEKQMVKEQDVLKIRGKCGKCVPVIVPKYLKRLLDYVSDKNIRKEAGISTSNIYMFASTRGGVIRGYNALVNISNMAGLKRPDLVRGTNNRAFFATVIQAFNTTQSEDKWIQDHFGHTANVHDIYYKRTSDTIERTVIAKILLLMDSNKIGHFKGRTLDDIELAEMCETIQEPEVREDLDGHEEEQTVVSKVTYGADDEEENYIPDLPEEDLEEEGALCQPKQKKKRKLAERHSWTPEELQELRLLFTFKKTPGVPEVKKAISKSKASGGQIWKLSIVQIKSKVSWLIRKS